ncbi:hypothetical protein BKA82DRAFT_153695 [Pisolithus tinctorius]|uniref:Uncharacterized protein n=1 Tax=Pisolithus tinctorius Marx 270 TaxID=870435 RepID=A0A0C3JRE6_PISTI|nr:hypothetical protein BKA82DRAFT_153695 [Pisolithus tinctorius]KIO00052.1 hypothetical protein M404DRAFT_153695 [Pisolithus tinctorius Marx 270]
MEFTCPTVLIDKEGGILLWYLPNAISQAYQSEVWNSLGMLSILLQCSLKSNGTSRWQHNVKNFHNAAILKGTINLSPAWFQQGNPMHHPKVSLVLKSKSCSKEVHKWLQCTAGLHAILSGVLWLIHLNMYLHRWEAITQLRLNAATWQDQDMEVVLPLWNLVYSSMSVMVNHTSPPHKDMNGWKVWLDTLLTIGNYPQLDFLILELGIQLQYNPGMVIALAGLALVHKVDGIDGDWACLAYYM